MLLPRTLAVLLLVATTGCTASRRAEPPATLAATLRRPAAGPVLGFETALGNHAWHGIPYAAPPVGPLRWRAPRPAEAWTEVRPALAIGAACPQFASPLGSDAPVAPGTVIGDEDCLYLNVHAPALARTDVPPRPGRGLPVMVWLHGGGNAIGHGGFYKPDALAASQGVVVVTINYRLGALGWFRHPALQDGAGAADALDASGNYALLDQLQALRWVQANIAAFGGEPGNVTVFGESAGGQDVLALLASPLGQGLFHRAIAQSAVVGGSSVSEAENLVDDATAPGHPASSREVLLRLLIHDGTAVDRGAARAHLERLSAPDIARYLRGQSPAELLAVHREQLLLGMYFVPTLIRDGVVLPERPLGACLRQAGCFRQVPLLLGTNRDETKLFQFWDPAQVERLFGVVPRLREPETYALRAEYLSALWKADAADELAAGLTAAGWPQVYVYRFDWDEEPSDGVDLAAMLGAAHGLEIPFVHGHWSLGPGTEFIYGADSARGRERLSAVMMSYWSAFAVDGDPGRGRGNDLPRWLPWQTDAAPSPGFMVLDTEAGGGLRRATDVVTRQGLLARLEQDPRLDRGDLRCRLRGELQGWFRLGALPKSADSCSASR